MEDKNIKGITVEIDADASGLDRTLDKVIEKAEKLDSLLREISEILHSFSPATPR